MRPQNAKKDKTKKHHMQQIHSQRGIRRNQTNKKKGNPSRGII